MKKQLFASVLVIFTLNANAQISKGSFLIAGNVSYHYNVTKSNTVMELNGQQTVIELSNTLRSFAVNPKIGYFVIRRLCVGVSMPVQFSKFKQKYSSPSSSTQTSFAENLSAGPFVRYYVPLIKKLFVLSEAAYCWGRSSHNSVYTRFVTNTGLITTTGGDLTHRRTDNGSISVGIAYLLNSNIGMELIGTRHIEPFTNHDMDQRFTVQFGLQIYLPKVN